MEEMSDTKISIAKTLNSQSFKLEQEDSTIRYPIFGDLCYGSTRHPAWF